MLHGVLAGIAPPQRAAKCRVLRPVGAERGARGAEPGVEAAPELEGAKVLRALPREEAVRLHTRQHGVALVEQAHAKDRPVLHIAVGEEGARVPRHVEDAADDRQAPRQRNCRGRHLPALCGRAPAPHPAGRAGHRVPPLREIMGPNRPEFQPFLYVGRCYSVCRRTMGWTPMQFRHVRSAGRAERWVETRSPGKPGLPAYGRRRAAPSCGKCSRFDRPGLTRWQSFARGIGARHLQKGGTRWN